MSSHYRIIVYVDEINALVVREESSDGGSCDQFQPISEQNDQKCWNFLKVRCMLLLKTYTGVSSTNHEPNLSWQSIDIASYFKTTSILLYVCAKMLTQTP